MISENNKAILNESAFSGIVIDNIEYGINDKVVFRCFYPVNNKTEYSERRTAKISYNNLGNAYFVFNDSLYFLNEFLRISD